MAVMRRQSAGSMRAGRLVSGSPCVAGALPGGRHPDLVEGFLARFRTTFHRMDTLSDEDLIGAVAKGDRHALEALYGRHRVKLYRFLVRLCAHEATAEDI